MVKKEKKPDLPNFGRDMQNWNPQTLLVGIQNGTSTLESGLVVPGYVKHTLVR